MIWVAPLSIVCKWLKPLCTQVIVFVNPDINVGAIQSHAPTYSLTTTRLAMRSERVETTMK